GSLLCLDLKDGHTLWSAAIGAKFVWTRASPLLVNGKVIYSHLAKGTPPVGVIEAWEADTGKPSWKVELAVGPLTAAGADGCAADDTVYFGAGLVVGQRRPEGERDRGQTVAVDARTGRIRWQSNEFYCASPYAAYPVLADGRLLLPMQPSSLKCVSPKDGKLLWSGGGNFTRHSVGSDFILGRAYGGYGAKFRLEDGKEYPGFNGNLGGDTHACGSVALTPNYSFAITVGGLIVRDVKTGALHWQSPGFAPRACVGVTLANGRVFWPSAASGM